MLTARPAVQAPVRHDLNGLRGIAIALVAVFHIWFGRVSGGVDVFLVLSGFFFGGRLLRTAYSDAPPINPLREFVRLVRRLLPALVVVLAACAAVTIWIQPQTRWEAFADESLASLGYFQNWQLADAAGAYQRAGEAVSPLQHLWSMSVQGQFFIALLLVVWLVALAVRPLPQQWRRAVVLVVLTAATVASFVYAVIVHGEDPVWAYYDSFARAWELLAGVLAAAVISVVRWPAWLRATAAIVGVAAILSVGALIDGAHEFPGPWALVPVVATLLIIFSGANPPADRDAPSPWPNRMLGAGWLVTLGGMAYALYLWHWPLLIFWLAYSNSERAGLTDGLIILMASLVLAYLTMRLVEDPLRHRKPTANLPPARRAPVMAMGGVVVVLTVAVVVASIGWREHVTNLRDSGGELLALSPRDYPGARALVENLRVAQLPMRPTVLEAVDDVPATTVDKCITDFGQTHVIKCTYGDQNALRTIALAGGSHAEHWIAALDLLGHRHGFKVVTYLKMGCPLTTDEVPLIAGSNDPYPQCREWVVDTMNELAIDRPDYVFTTTTRPQLDGPGDFVPDAYLGIWDEFAAYDLTVLGVRDTPWMFRDGLLFAPADCLAEGGSAESCGVPRSEALSDYNPTMDYLSRYPAIVPLDLSDAVCGPDYCRAVEGNVLVYHDAHHLSATYTRTMADELGRQLGEATGWW